MNQYTTPEALRVRIIGLGASQRDIGELADVKQPLVSAWTRGKRPAPTWLDERLLHAETLRSAQYDMVAEAAEAAEETGAEPIFRHWDDARLWARHHDAEQWQAATSHAAIAWLIAERWEEGGIAPLCADAADPQLTPNWAATSRLMRRGLGIPQTWLAHALEISNGTLSAIEAEHTPRLPTLWDNVWEHIAESALDAYANVIDHGTTLDSTFLDQRQSCELVGIAWALYDQRASASSLER